MGKGKETGRKKLGRKVVDLVEGEKERNGGIELAVTREEGKGRQQEGTG